ncbi:MAG: topoisomerase DNA-binding C4 zinc finger domain-containing protein [Oscillospiraceae bacterium]
MSRTTDQCTTIDANANEETNADTFASYVRASKKCPSCGRPMKLIKSKSGKFFLACAGYPACRKTLPVDIDMIEEYFYRNSKKGQHCVQCGYSLEAKAGKYGVYVQCCGAQRHEYKLDEI